MHKTALNILVALGILTIVGSSPTLVLAGKSNAEYANNLEKQNNSNFLTYQDSANKISIQYPRDWIKKEVNNTVIFASPQENSADKFQDNISVLVKELPTSQITLDEITEATLPQLRQAIADFNLVSSNDINLASNRGHQVVYTGRQGNFNIKWMQIWTLKNNKFYVITYVAEASSYSNFLRTIQQMVDSFRIL